MTHFSDKLIYELSAELLKSVDKDVLSVSCRHGFILTLGRCPPNMSQQVTESALVGYMFLNVQIKSQRSQM